MTLSLLKVKKICVAVLSLLVAGCGTLDAIVSSGKADSTIRITSTPPGADLYIMGKHLGTTPTTINNLDIYPVSYDISNEKSYGMVFLRKDGCEEYSRRLTRADIHNGLSAALVCGADDSAPTPPTPVTPVAPIASATYAPASAPAEPPAPQPQQLSLPERRLQQLKTLLQLHDEGLISDEEENKMRRRILEASVIEQD